MSYRLINANDLNGKISDEDYKVVLNTPCIYADLPNGFDNEYYKIPGWIPVTEKEPTKGERVLMTLKNDEADKEVVIGTMSMNLDGKFHIDDCGALYVFDMPTVIAWMPLPKPYETESSETEQGLAYADQETMMSAT